MIEILAAASSSNNGLNPLGLIGTILFAGVVLYLFILRPQRSRLRKQQLDQDSLEVGDDVMTSAGIFGTITDIDEDTDVVTVEIAPGTEVRMLRRAVSRRFEEPASDEDEDYSDEDYSEDESGGEDEDYSDESGGEEAGAQP
jgi:preprotein translocase subunit YajC